MVYSFASSIRFPVVVLKGRTMPIKLITPMEQKLVKKSWVTMLERPNVMTKHKATLRV